MSNTSKVKKARKVRKGTRVDIHYVGTFDDGTEFDSSRLRGEELSFKVGSGELIAGFDSALKGMTVGETKKVKLTPAEAYGEPDTELFHSVPQTAFPPDFDFQIGAMVQGQSAMGEQAVARIDSVNEDTVVLDFNHPMAGKNLNFEIELVNIK